MVVFKKNNDLEKLGLKNILIKKINLKAKIILKLLEKVKSNAKKNLNEQNINILKTKDKIQLKPA